MPIDTVRRLLMGVVVLQGILCGSVAGEATTQQDKAVRDGPKLTLVYFTGSNCAPCNFPEVKSAVLEAKRIVAEKALARGVGFTTIGVAIDEDPEKGLEFLKSVGPFDQLSAGGEFANLVVLETMAKTPRQLIAIPMILVFEQSIDSTDRKLHATERTYLAAIPGTGIPLWVKHGTRLSDEPQPDAQEAKPAPPAKP